MTQESKTRNEEDEDIDNLMAAGFVQLLILTGVLIAWLFTPLYALTTPAFSVSLTPWGIVLKTPSVHKVLYTGTVHLILGFLLADLILLIIGVFTGGIVSPAIYLLSAGVLFLVNSYLIPLAGIQMDYIFNTQMHELLAISGQKVVPMNIVNTLYWVLIILMAISLVVSLSGFSYPRH